MQKLRDLAKRALVPTQSQRGDEDTSWMENTSILDEEKPHFFFRGHTTGNQTAPTTDEPIRARTVKSIKLGWIAGVLVPCLLNIWSVTLFLRIPWVTAQCGVFFSLFILLFSCAICIVTTLSMSALCTNGNVKYGGIYYIISRSLGPQFGASIGLIFAFANCAAAALNTVGFCESFNDLLKSFGLSLYDNGYVDTRIVGTILLVLMVVVDAVGVDWESKAQTCIFWVIVMAMANLALGALVGPHKNQDIANGFVGFSWGTLWSNMSPDYTISDGVHHNSFTVFGVLFPAVTGIQAGINNIGDLKNPTKAIPKGTLLAILVALISYSSIIIASGGSALRQASGRELDVQYFKGILDTDNLAKCLKTAAGCPRGLHNDYTIMQFMALWNHFIYFGCWAATISTALTTILAVPRLLQVLGLDQIYPGLMFFAKPYGRLAAPYRGYAVTLIGSLLFLFFGGKINVLSPLITVFYLAAYALVNFCVFHADFVKPLGWRPTFKYYSHWLSLAGCVLCLWLMFMLDWVLSLLIIAAFIFLYLVVQYRSPNVNWGSTTQAQTYKMALASVYNLTRTEEHVQNYWPKILVLCGRPQRRPGLVKLANLITNNESLVVIGDIVQKNISYHEWLLHRNVDYKWIYANHLRAFKTSVAGFNFEHGARALMQSVGVGRLAPNILLVGYKADWRAVPMDDLQAYFNVLHSAFKTRISLALLRIPGGLDVSMMPDGPMPIIMDHRVTNLLYTDSDLSPPPRARGRSTQRNRSHSEPRKPDVSISINSIHEDFITPGQISVWWLYDDGGLTIYVPSLIAQRDKWNEHQPRLFVLPKFKEHAADEERIVLEKLATCHLNYSSVTMLETIEQPPQQSTVDMFNQLMAKFTTSAEGSSISESEMSTHAVKTSHHLRLRELLLEEAGDAALIVLSLPFPRKAVPPPLYMAWLEILSADLPPVLFIRGATNVISLNF